LAPRFRPGLRTTRHHRIRPYGHAGAGEDAHRAAARRRPVERVTGGGAPGDRQRCLGGGIEVVDMDRIAVDGGVVVRRHIVRRDHILGQDAPQRRGQRHRLRLGDAHQRPLQQGQRRSGAQQRPAEGETVVAELRHGLPAAA